MPDFFGRMVGLMNIEANTNLLNAEAQGSQILAQERALDVQLKQQYLRDQATTAQIQSDILRGDQLPQMRGDQQVDVGDPLVTSLSKQVARDTQTAQQLRQLANAVQGHVSPESQKQKEKEANDAEHTAIATENAYRVAQSDLAKKMGSIAGSALDANDNEGFRQAYQQLASLDPRYARSLTVDRDTNGIPTWGPKSQRAMEMVRDQGMTASEQIARATQIKTELLREQADKRADERLVLEGQRTDALIASNRALGEKREAETEFTRRKMARLDELASKPATPDMRNVAMASIKSDPDFKDVKWDSKALDAFSGDVADRANKIRSDEAKLGRDMDAGEARQQAIAELKPFVQSGEEGGFKVPYTDVKIGGEKKLTYSRGTTAPPAMPDAPPEVVAFMDKMDRQKQVISHTGPALPLPDKPEPSKMKKGSVYQTPRGLALWDGTKFVQ